jgi:hypothetical protein
MMRTRRRDKENSSVSLSRETFKKISGDARFWTREDVHDDKEARTLLMTCFVMTVQYA